MARNTALARAANGALAGSARVALTARSIRRMVGRIEKPTLRRGDVECPFERATALRHAFFQALRHGLANCSSRRSATVASSTPTPGRARQTASLLGWIAAESLVERSRQGQSFGDGAQRLDPRRQPRWRWGPRGRTARMKTARFPRQAILRRIRIIAPRFGDHPRNLRRTCVDFRRSLLRRRAEPLSSAPSPLPAGAGFASLPWGFPSPGLRSSSASRQEPMDKFTTLTGVAAPLPIDKHRHGHDHPQAISQDDQAHRAWRGPLLGDALSRGRIRESQDFILNKPPTARLRSSSQATISAAAHRAGAPWALTDFGVRCVIATDFADIFYNNCFKNGLLPIKVSREDLAKLHDDAERGANATLTIDLEAQEIRGPDGGVVRFEIDPFRKHCLIEGLDDIGLTLVETSAIEAHEKKTAAAHPWR